jgi:excisionase family DNA binding protein
MQEALLTPKDVCDRCSISIHTLYQLTHRKSIPHIKIKRIVRFRLQDIEKWKEDNSTKMITDDLL